MGGEYMSSNRLNPERLKELVKYIHEFSKITKGNLLSYAAQKKQYKDYLVTSGIGLNSVMERIDQLLDNQKSKKAKPLLAFAVINDLQSEIDALNHYIKGNSNVGNSAAMFSHPMENKKVSEIGIGVDSKLKKIELLFRDANNKLKEIENSNSKINKSEQLPVIFQEAGENTRKLRLYLRGESIQLSDSKSEKKVAGEDALGVLGVVARLMGGGFR